MSARIARLRQAPDPALVDRLEEWISQVVRGLDDGKDCDRLVAQINALSGRDYEPAFFFELDGWTGAREAAAAAAKGPPPALADLTREELVEMVGIIRAADEPDCGFFLDLLERSFPDAWSSDLVYHYDRERTAEEIVEELLLRRRLYLSGGAGAVRAHEVALAQGVERDPDAPPWAQQWAAGVLTLDEG